MNICKRFRLNFERREGPLLPVVDEDFVFSAVNKEYISATDAITSDNTNTATIASIIIHPPSTPLIFAVVSWGFILFRNVL